MKDVVLDWWYRGNSRFASQSANLYGTHHSDKKSHPFVLFKSKSQHNHTFAGRQLLSLSWLPIPIAVVVSFLTAAAAAEDAVVTTADLVSLIPGAAAALLSDIFWGCCWVAAAADTGCSVVPSRMVLLDAILRLMVEVWLKICIVDCSILEVVSTVSYFFSLTCNNRIYHRILKAFPKISMSKQIDRR